MLEHQAVRVPATTANLGAGYDTFGAAVDLHLFARTVDRTGRAERVRTRGEGGESLECGDDNLVWRSFVGWCERHEVAVPDVAVDVTSGIPLERGLGSSSAAIVAGLALARAVTDTPPGDLGLAQVAAELEGHPDNVVPAVVGGLTVSVRGDDGALVVRRVQPHPRLRPVVLVPQERQATVVARGVVPSELALSDVTMQVGRATHAFGALAGLWPAEPGAVGDRLHEPARLPKMADSGSVLARLRDDQQQAWLSGAGPSVVAATSLDDMSSFGPVAAAGWRVLPLAWDLAGLVTCPAQGRGCVRAGNERCVQCPAERVL